MCDSCVNECVALVPVMLKRVVAFDFALRARLVFLVVCCTSAALSHITIASIEAFTQLLLASKVGRTTYYKSSLAVGAWP
jgi:hypothetical protein